MYVCMYVCMYIYIYIYAPGLVCRPFLGIYKLISGLRRVTKRPPPSEITVFVVLHFAENRLLSDGGIGLFKKITHLGGPFARGFWLGQIRLFFLFHLWRFGSWRRNQRGRKTRNASKQGVSERFGVFLRLQLPLDELDRLDFAQLCWNIYFCRSYKFVFFGSSNFWPNWVWRAKNSMGLQNWGRFENGVFHIFPGEDQFVIFAARGCVAFGFESGSLPKMALRLRRGGFLRFCRGFLFRHRCRQYEEDLFKLPSSSSSCFSLFCVFFLGLGSTQPCTCVFGQLALNPPFFFSFCLFTKTLFSLWKRVIFVNFSVSPFLSPWLLALLLFTLSLSLYSCFLFFCSFLVVLSFSFLPVFLCCSFLPCFFAFVSWKEQHQNITFERFLFINSLLFFWFPVLCVSLKSRCLIFVFPFLKLCVLVNIHVLISQRGPFLKHRFLFCTLCKHYHFYWGPILGANFGWCSKITVKIGISAHCQEQQTRQTSTILRGSPLGRVGVIIWAKWKCGDAGTEAEHDNQCSDILWFDLVSCHTKRECKKEKQWNEK